MWTRRAGLQRLNAFTPDAIRRALEQAELSLQGSSQFQDFYVFAFRYCLTVRLLVLLIKLVWCRLHTSLSPPLLRKYSNPHDLAGT